MMEACPLKMYQVTKHISTHDQLIYVLLGITAYIFYTMFCCKKIYGLFPRIWGSKRFVVKAYQVVLAFLSINDLIMYLILYTNLFEEP